MAIKPLTIKVTAGIIGVGGAGIIGHQTYKALQTKPSEIEKASNGDKLISEKYKLLGKEKTNDDTWQAILDSYKKVIENKTDLAFLGFDGLDKEGQKALDTLKTKCEETLNSKDETLLNKGRKWCIVPITVEKALEGRRILKLENNKDTEDQTEWDEKIKNYTKTGKNNEIKNFAFSDSTPITQPNKGHRDLIRNKCKELNGKKSYEEDYETALKSSTDWCSVEKNN